MKMRWMQFLVALGILSTGLVGCGGGGGGNTTELPDPQVKFINGSPNTVGLDYLLNDVIKAANVAYLGTNADFLTIPYIKPQDDGYDIGVRTAGGAEDLDRLGTVFNRDSSTLIVALGLQDPLLEPEKRLRIQLYGIIRTAPTGTKARVLFINGFIRNTGFESPNVTFQSIDAGDPSPYNNPLVVTRDVAYTDLRTLTVDAGSYNFLVRRADTDALVQYATQSVTLGAGKLYVALMTGQESNPDVNLQPKIQFIELSTIN